MRNCFYSIILLLLFAVAAQAELTLGADGCYAIASKEDFASFMNNHSSECGKLTADINLGSWTPAASFSGTLDGQGHSITLMNIDKNGNKPVGMISLVDAPKSKPAVLKNIHMEQTTVSGKNGTNAALVGSVSGFLKIENCYVSAVVNASTNKGNPAAIFVASVGSSGSVVIENSYNDGEVVMSGQNNYIGGFVADNSGAVYIENCVDNGLGFVGNNASGATFTKIHVSEILPSTPDSEKQAILEQMQAYADSVGSSFSWVIDDQGEVISRTVLQWTAPSQSFAVNELGGSIVIADGQSLYANGVIYSGTLSDAQKKAIGANTLRPVSGVSYEGDKAVVSGSSQAPIIIPDGFIASSAALDRNFSIKTQSTLILPFTAKLTNAFICTFKGVAQQSDGTWYVTVMKVADSVVHANTPYIVQSSDNELQFTDFKGFAVNSEVHTTIKGNWKFTGVNKYIKWKEDELGHIYGFAGSASEKFKAGQFVRGAYGASVSPTRAFLVYDASLTTSRPGVNGSRMSIAPADLPESIDVVIEEEDGSSMRIGQLNTLSGEISVDHTIAKDRWFSVDGRKLNAKPTAKGTYYNNGKRVIVK